METLDTTTIANLFGNRLRIRVCGFCLEDNSVLLIKHINLGNRGIFWSPPGGGMEYGENVGAALKREFLEESGLEIRLIRFLCINEFLEPPLHAIELFFLVNKIGGNLILGVDPEISSENQLIQQTRFFSFQELEKMDKELLHSLFSNLSSLDDIEKLDGYYLNGSKID